jgi:hypothetical protein
MAISRPAESGGGQGGAGTHPEYYSTVIVQTVDDPRRIDVVRSVGSQPPPQDYRDLLKQIQDVARLVVMLFPADLENRRDLFGQLHATADSGLRGTESSIEIGLDNLNEVKGSVADAFPVIREVLWRKNLTILVVTILLCLPTGAALYYNSAKWFPPPGPEKFHWSGLAIAALWVPLGVAIGLFLEFIFRVGDDIPYEQLRSINPGRWKPVQRFFNTVMVGYTFAGVLAIDAVQVGVSNVLLNEFVKGKPFLSLAIGFVTGMAFPYVRDLVQQFRPVRRDQAP